MIIPDTWHGRDAADRTQYEFSPTESAYILEHFNVGNEEALALRLRRDQFMIAWQHNKLVRALTKKLTR